MPVVLGQVVLACQFAEGGSGQVTQFADAFCGEAQAALAERFGVPISRIPYADLEKGSGWDAMTVWFAAEINVSPAGSALATGIWGTAAGGELVRAGSTDAVPVGPDLAAARALARTLVAGADLAAAPRQRSETIGSAQQMTVGGVRATLGDAVACPQIRTDEGQLIAVHYLAPDIAIGDRVEVSGFMTYVTTCQGPVLYVQQVRRLP